MSVAIAVSPDSPEAVTDSCMIAVSGSQKARDPDGTGGPLVCYIEASMTGEKSLISERFTPSADGDWLWQGVIFPTDGSWTVDLKDDDDDSVIATDSVTVTAQS